MLSFWLIFWIVYLSTVFGSQGVFCDFVIFTFKSVVAKQIFRFGKLDFRSFISSYLNVF